MKTTACPHCTRIKYELQESGPDDVTPCDDCEPILEAGRVEERARIRGWLGQQAGQAERDRHKTESLAGKTISSGRHAAFKEAADHLKPTHVKAGLAAKRAARKAVNK